MLTVWNRIRYSLYVPFYDHALRGFGGFRKRSIDSLDIKYRNKINVDLDALKLSRELVDLSMAPVIREEQLELEKFSDQANMDLIDFFKEYSFSFLLT